MAGRVLLVDDDQAVLSSLTRALTHLDVQSETARSAYRVDVQTGRTEALATLYDFPSPGDAFDLSRDGRFLYYRSPGDSNRPGPGVVFRKDLVDGSTREVFRVRGIIRSMSISPDGSLLALSFQTGDQMPPGHQFGIVPSGGGEFRELTPLGPGITSIAWTPDGRTILFVRREEDSDTSPEVALWRIPAEGGEPSRLGLGMVGMRDLRVHPDGRRIAFTAGELSAELWVMENFLPPSR